MKVKILNSHIEKIVEGYKKENNFYQQLFKVSQQIEEFLVEKDLDRLSQLLLSREDIISGIKGIEEEIAENKQIVMAMLHLKEFDLSRVKDLIYPQLWKQLQGERDQIEKTVRKLLELDAKNEGFLAEQVKELSNELKNIHQHFQLQKVYLDRPEDFPDPRFFDEKK